MILRAQLLINYVGLASLLMAGCSPTRQLAVDFPSNADAKTQTTQAQPFSPVAGFQAIDGDDYYVRLISDFDFQGDNVLKSGCANLAPSYDKNDLSSALIFSVRNESLKFNNDIAAFSYQSGNGKCNFKFEAKKQILTPWMRLDTGKQTAVDYSFYSTNKSDVDVNGLIGDVTAASSLLSLTGVGMGVAVIGQYAGQWAKQNQQKNTAVAQAVSLAKNSSESHSLPPVISFAGNKGILNQTIFKVYAVQEGGINILSSDTQPIGKVTIYPEMTPSLLLKTTAEGLPDARDLSFEEIGYLPIKTGSGEMKLRQLLDDSKHPLKPVLNPKWDNYADVESNCRKIKLVLKDLGFNKFDRDAFLYYFLNNSEDWKNYNISPAKAIARDLTTKTLTDYRAHDFGNCLTSDDYKVIKAMGLSVNTIADWEALGESVQKKEQSFSPLKSIERQLLAVLKNSAAFEMERQLYPLLATASKGAGTVLLQDRLGDFGLEKLINESPAPAVSTAGSPAAPHAAGIAPIADTVLSPPDIPNEGLIVGARQLAHVFAGLLIDQLSCARPAPGLADNSPGNIGLMLFTTRNGSPRNKGAALEFEFAAGKISRIAFQLPTFRDFEQDLADRPAVGGCRIDSAWLNKLH
jgi:hypothetical protein